MEAFHSCITSICCRIIRPIEKKEFYHLFIIMSSIGGHQRQDSPMVDEMLDGAQMDVTDSEVIYKDTYTVVFRFKLDFTLPKMKE